LPARLLRYKRKPESLNRLLDKNDRVRLSFGAVALKRRGL
jgi:hypothetical protein